MSFVLVFCHSTKDCILFFTEILFFTGIASVSMIGGFSAALTRTKKKDPDYFMKVRFNNLISEVTLFLIG